MSNYCKVFENIWYAVIIYWDLSPQQAKFGNKTGGRYPPKALRDMYKTSYIYRYIVGYPRKIV